VSSSEGTRAARRLPPFAELAVVSIALMMAGGIYLAAQIPGRPPLGVAIGLVAAGAVITAVDLALLARVKEFAWGTFFLVIRWALLAYAVIAGLLLFTFAWDGTPAGTMAVLAVTLVVFALDVPAILAFTVAKFA
jgi:hypothetical protein